MLLWLILSENNFTPACIQNFSESDFENFVELRK